MNRDSIGLLEGQVSPDEGTPHIEVVTRASAEDDGQGGRGRLHRLWIFLIVFFLVLIPGAIWDFMRPPQFMASATVLTAVSRKVGLGMDGEAADLQHVAVQRQLLLGNELLRQTLALAKERLPIDVDTVDLLRTMLSVKPEAETNLVVLSATGGDPEQLATLVNAWIDAYKGYRQAQIERDVGETLTKLEEEHQRLGDDLAQRRKGLEVFRAEHDIVSLESSGNEAMARLNGLTTALNEAQEEAVEASARLTSIRAAVAAGEPVVPAEERASLASMEEAVALQRAKLAGLRNRYTRMYLENEPTVREIPIEIASLEARIEKKMDYGRRLVVGQAQRELEQASERVQILQTQLQAQKSIAGGFSDAFAEYQALNKDLEHLEKLYSEKQTVMVEIQTMGQEKYPQVEVVEAAFPPGIPFQPKYWEDLLWILLAAFGSALMTVLLVEFLTRSRTASSGQVPVTGVRVFGAIGSSSSRLGADRQPPALQAAAATPELSRDPALQLADARPRELIPAEVDALWSLSDPTCRQFMALLLSGLTVDECRALDAQSFDLEQGLVHVPGDIPREIALAPPLIDLFGAYQSIPLWESRVAHTSVDELAHRIGLLAHDAGLSQPDQVNPAALRHTYIAYLVRQGARLTSLSKLLGPVLSVDLGRYSALAPAGQAKPLEDVDLIYPLLAATARGDL